jgi:uncharacterized membrane protein affecting hemolysin expression
MTIMRVRGRWSSPAATVPLPAALLAVLLAGCGGNLTPEQRAQQCSNLAQALASQGLSGVPTEQQAIEIGNRLDLQLNQLGDPTVHDAAVALHSHVHAIEAAVKRGDTAKATELAGEARKDVAKAAKACGLPDAQFIG